MIRSTTRVCTQAATAVSFGAELLGDSSIQGLQSLWTGAQASSLAVSIVSDAATELWWRPDHESRARCACHIHTATRCGNRDGCAPVTESHLNSHLRRTYRRPRTS